MLLRVPEVELVIVRSLPVPFPVLLFTLLYGFLRRWILRGHLELTGSHDLLVNFDFRLHFRVILGCLYNRSSRF